MSQRYVEIVIVTAKGIGEGFIMGWFRAKDDPSKVLNLEREEIERESFKELLEEFTHPGEEILHLLISEKSRGTLEEALQKLGEEGFAAEVRGSRTHENASAGFRLELYNKDAGKTAKRLLTEKREGVVIEFGKELKETKRNEAAGVEMYAPDHSYELKGSGILEGGIEPVLAMIKALRETGAEIKEIKLS